MINRFFHLFLPLLLIGCVGVGADGDLKIIAVDGELEIVEVVDLSAEDQTFCLTFSNSADPTFSLLGDITYDANIGVTTQILTQPTWGTLTALSDNQVRFTPTADFMGQDTFTYRVTQGEDSFDLTGTISFGNVFNSYDLTIRNDYAGGAIENCQGDSLTGAFYYSTGRTNVTKDSDLHLYSSTAIVDTYSGHAYTGAFWSGDVTHTASTDYPYLGKMDETRGSYTNETGQIAPYGAGIYDISIHPPHHTSNGQMVLALTVNQAGDYYLYNFGGRRLAPTRSEEVVFNAYDNTETLVSTVTGDFDQAWDYDAATLGGGRISLGTLSVGDKIYFTADRGADNFYYFDAGILGFSISIE